MVLLTFSPPVAPSPGTTTKPEFKMLSASFGDGYSQEAGDGINHIRDVVTLEWTTLLPAQAEQIIAFLKARKGGETFLYRLSDAATVQKWTCADYSNKRGEGGLRTVNASFRESFNVGS